MWEFTEQELKGVYCITPFFTEDLRGSFVKNYVEDAFIEHSIEMHIMDSFISKSDRNVVRGLHFQTHTPQAKLIQVVSGGVWDVVVDLRKDSETYKRWIGIEINDSNHRMLYIPRGFAHGYLSLREDTIMVYQCEPSYDKYSDTGVRYDDPDIAVEWPISRDKMILSDRDKGFGYLSEYENGDVFENTDL